MEPPHWAAELLIRPQRLVTPPPLLSSPWTMAQSPPTGPFRQDMNKGPWEFPWSDSNPTAPRAPGTRPRPTHCTSHVFHMVFVLSSTCSTCSNVATVESITHSASPMKPFLIIEAKRAIALARHCPALSPQFFRDKHSLHVVYGEVRHGCTSVACGKGLRPSRLMLL